MLTRQSERTIYLRVLAPLLLAVVTLVAVSVGGFLLLTGARAYVGGESLWSKAASQTVAQLRARLTNSAARPQCAPFDEWLAVPLGDRAARLALDRPDPDLAAARAGFIRGGNSADDADDMIRLYRHFGTSALMRDSVAAWRRGDELIAELRALGDAICALPAGGGDAASRAAQLAALDRLDAELLAVEARFSAALGESSRSAEHLLTAMIALLATLLLGASGWYALRSLRAQIEQGRALTEANDRWELAAEAAGIGRFVWRLDDDTFELDDRGRSIYQLDPAMARVQPRTVLRERVHPEDRDSAVRVARSAAEGQPLHLHYRIVMADGSVRYLVAYGLLRETSAAPTAQGARRIFGVVRDITSETDATRMQHERDTAERVARARTEFMSRLSHELRTPLNAVLGMAQVLEVDKVEPLGPRQRQRVEMILQSGWHLLRLVDDVLDITNVDAGVLAIAAVPTAPREALVTSLALTEPERAATGVTIVDRWPAEPARVLADPQRLQQVFANLLSNAFKYNRHGGRVTLEARETGRELGLTIADEGHGIAEAEIAELFQPFKRLESTSGVPGTGLGLVVVKLLVEQMSGRVEVASEVGVGTRFTVWLPKA